jgi:hypothetical protein
MTMWTRLFLILFWGSLASNAYAQKTGRIVIIAPGGIGASATHLLNAVKPHYTSPVGLDTKLPQDLTEVDAVMMLRPDFNHGLPWLDSADQIRLIKYLESGGKFYAEGEAFRAWSAPNDDTTDNQLWDFIGDTLETYTALVVSISQVSGVKGTFTDGLNFPHEPRWGGDASMGFYMLGMMPVLIGDQSYALATISENPQIKAVLHWPIATEHYNAFLARVVCNYFNLCTLNAPVENQDSPRIRFDPTTSEVHLPRAGNIVISDILGREVLKTYAETERYRLPEHLVKGSYILRWSTSNAHASVKISIF